ncbi:serine hydrolase [Legionella quateirensis]|uniref:AMPC cephalosporinase n=1 Tax=Legionella quateirensis TaxID=45072 RepID=A0A378KWB1_9GAMM|nr:serine hydrolase [Legionella quateirensis]KTD51107.1 AMPC cephalosporinase [Legionella quateirensis]STY17648.1 AMPC cephalosporinase [Legionella quateirensis]
MKLKQLILFISIFILCHAVTAAQSDADKNLDLLVHSITKPFISSHQIPGVSIAVYYHGQDYFYNYGVADKQKGTPVTKDTIFELASITKIFVSTLLALEVEEGKIKLSDSVAHYIPQLNNTKGLPIDRVEVVNLATHTASFPRQMEQFGVARSNRAAFIKQLKSWHPKVRIGTQYKYSNIGFGFLGLILEQATGTPLTTLTAQNISEPLGMTHTYFNVPQSLKVNEAQGYRNNNNKAPYYVPANYLGGGALRSSSADMLNFMKANLGIKVNDASSELLTAMKLAQQPVFVVRPKFIMGLGWQRVIRGNNLLITKNGGNQGFNTFIGFSPEKKVGVVVLTNKAKVNATRLGNLILNALVN